MLTRSVATKWTRVDPKTGLQKQTQYSHRQEGECMMDEMVERLMHVELVLEFEQVELVLNLLSPMDFAAEMHVQTRYINHNVVPSQLRGGTM